MTQAFSAPDKVDGFRYDVRREGSAPAFHGDGLANGAPDGLRVFATQEGSDIEA